MKVFLITFISVTFLSHIIATSCGSSSSYPTYTGDTSPPGSAASAPVFLSSPDSNNTETEKGPIILCKPYCTGPYEVCVSHQYNEPICEDDSCASFRAANKEKEQICTLKPSSQEIPAVIYGYCRCVKGFRRYPGCDICVPECKCPRVQEFDYRTNIWKVMCPQRPVAIPFKAKTE